VFSDSIYIVSTAATPWRLGRRVWAHSHWVLALLLGFSIFVHPVRAAHIRVTTWNLDWFPDGSAKGASPEKQERRIREVADVLRHLDPDIILLQEIRDYDTCTKLAETIRPGAYQVAICSAFKEPFHAGLGRQQVAILAKKPAQAAWAEKWKSMEGIDPPRGFAFAWFQLDGADFGVYSVHLKSNLIIHGDKEIEATKNMKKREVAANQLINHMRGVIATAIPGIRSEVVAGDFNTNTEEFPNDDTLKTLEGAGFQNCMEHLTELQKITHPGGHGYPDTTFDYVLAQHAQVGPPLITHTNVSDHYPVTCDIDLPSSAKGSSEQQPVVPPTSALPTTVTITQPVVIEIPYGQAVLQPGMKLPVVARDGDNVRVSYMGGTQSLPATSTDIPQ
jgi:endonuclease/exonuclease/phosphatase family metal-dependent hydrolase